MSNDLSVLNLPGGHPFEKFLGDLFDQNDRGLAVLGVAFVEWRIVEAIRLLLPVKGKSVEKLLGKDGDTGKLEYESKCYLAHALGIVGDDGLSDLQTIGRI